MKPNSGRSFLRISNDCFAWLMWAPGTTFPSTAHGREAYAISRLIQDVGDEQSPTFHLEFRHPVATLDELDAGKLDTAMLDYTRVHQAYFDACRAHRDTTRYAFLHRHR